MFMFFQVLQHYLLLLNKEALVILHLNSLFLDTIWLSFQVIKASASIAVYQRHCFHQRFQVLRIFSFLLCFEGIKFQISSWKSAPKNIFFQLRIQYLCCLRLFWEECREHKDQGNLELVIFITHENDCTYDLQKMVLINLFLKHCKQCKNYF